MSHAARQPSSWLIFDVSAEDIVKYLITLAATLIAESNGQPAPLSRVPSDTPAPETWMSDVTGFLRSSTTTGPNVESKLMARRFALYHVLPLAWSALPDGSYCLRVAHVHSPKSSAPTSRGICVEIRGCKGHPAIVLAEVDQVGTKWITKIISAAVADELIAVVHSAKLLELPQRDRPHYLGSYGFALEFRTGEAYRFMRFDAPGEDTKARGLEGLLDVLKRTLAIAEVPDSEVFFGDPKRS